MEVAKHDGALKERRGFPLKPGAVPEGVRGRRDGQEKETEPLQRAASSLDPDARTEQSP